MQDAADLITRLADAELDFFTGVPDSLLKSLCACIQDRVSTDRHIIAANEGNAVAIATGYHLATGKSGVVYMQNSGLGNAVNPLASLADPEVYRIPMLLLIGWRGEPGVKDEPQHMKQGRITPGQLELLDIPYAELSAATDLEEVLPPLVRTMHDRSGPVALLVRKGTFAPYSITQKKAAAVAPLRREDALRWLLDHIPADARIVSTTGKTSRELYELRKARGESTRDFLTVGSMGHASSIAFGVALGDTTRRVVCIDGDGAFLMHLGALPVIGAAHPQNLIHILLNNAAHESVGGQPTVAGRINVPALAQACGYTSCLRATTEDELQDAWARLDSVRGPTFLEIVICTGSRPDLGRPDRAPEETKKAFMAHGIEA